MDNTELESQAQSLPGDEVYTLTIAMLIVRQIETTPTRLAVFSEIKEKNRIIGFADRVYSMTGSATVRRLILFMYMQKCTVALNAKTSPTASAVAIANFSNEVSTIDRISAMIPEVEISLIGMSRKNAFARGQLREVGWLIAVMPRIWRLLGKISKAHSFMPACRISSVLAYYFRLSRLLDANPSLTAAIVASNYSPESVALAAAAHNRNRKVVYINHAPVPHNSPYVPPVLADCSVFYGDSIRETYESRSRCQTQSVFIGQPGETIDMVFSNEPESVGIFLTALTRKDTIAKLVQQIMRVNPTSNIMIRHHPVALLETDLSDLCHRYTNIKVTLGLPLNADIANCDIVICGNSGVTLNVLGRGRPVAYVPELDDLPFDYNGFIEKGLVPHIQEWNETTYSSLKLFFRSPEWPNVMTSYDSSYGRSVDEMEKIARKILLSHLNYRP